MSRPPTPDILGDILDAQSVSQETPAGDVPVYRVPTAKIDDNPFQTRIRTDVDHIVGLARSIADLKVELPATMGLQQPPLARLMIDFGHGLEPVPPVMYNNGAGVPALLRREEVIVQLAFGHSRLRAFRLLAEGAHAVWGDEPGIETLIESLDDQDMPFDADYAVMPLIIGQADEFSMWRHAVTENQQRKDISAVEEALSLRQAMTEFDYTTEQAAATFGWQRSTAANKLRLLKLPVDVQDAIVAGDITEKHGRALLQLVDAPDRLKRISKGVLNGDWSVAELEERITDDIESLPTPHWALDWDPASDGEPEIAGPCDCCDDLAILQKAPRCLNRKCWMRKNALWPVEAPARQKAAARKALDAAGQESVPVQEESQERTYKYGSHHAFGDYPAKSELIENGKCGPHCSCYAACHIKVIYEQEREYHDYVQPEPDSAPNVLMICTSEENLYEKLDELKAEQNPEETEEQRQQRIKEEEENQRRKAKVQAAHDQAHAHLDAAVDRAGSIEALWGSRSFLDELAIQVANANERDRIREQLPGCDDDQVRRIVLESLLWRFRSWNAGVRSYIHDLDDVRAFANRIAPSD